MCVGSSRAVLCEKKNRYLVKKKGKGKGQRKSESKSQSERTAKTEEVLLNSKDVKKSLKTFFKSCIVENVKTSIVFYYT